MKAIQLDHEQRQDKQETLDEYSLITVGDKIVSFEFVHKFMSIKGWTHKIL